jgi:RNA polymerase sigma factor (sigma-70 family)
VLQLGLAISQAHVSGDHRPAITETEVLAKDRDGWTLEGLARLCALASAAVVAGGREADPASEIWEEYASRAVELLYLAAGTGHRDGVFLREGVDLTSLRHRPDFQKLLAESEAKRENPGPMPTAALLRVSITGAELPTEPKLSPHVAKQFTEKYCTDCSAAGVNARRTRHSRTQLAGQVGENAIDRDRALRVSLIRGCGFNWKTQMFRIENWRERTIQLAEWTEWHDAVASLPGDEREVFDLMWYHGLSQPEVAGVLDISLRTVKRRWRRTRLLLHAHLKPSEESLTPDVRS